MADKTEHIVGHQTADRAGRIDGGHHPAFGIEDEAGCLETDGIVIDEAAGDCGNRSRVGAVSDRETELVLFDERLRLFPIV